MDKRYTFQDLLDIMTKLRGENGCPWDREQTHDSLKKYMLEEAYEAVDAIEDGSKEKLYEELGDVLLQVVFHSVVAKEEGTFTIDDVTTSICSKLITRHPHIFGDEEIKDASGVEQRWDQIKEEKRGLNTHTQILEDVPKHLPALMRSYKIQKKAAEVGFDWDDVDDAIKKVYEELEEIKEVYKTDKQEKIFEEIGDLLFSVVNVSRFLKVEPETALSSTIGKFVKRFSYIESTAQKQGRNLESMSLEEMDKLWEEAKNQ